ncbi:MAG: ADP-ribosylglycohydrolase family protein, partial [Symploca sp. SIO2D2]|nr:ADP-ribosylglycohydrolase family protein [Symploca sp. SIO2D2]
MESAQNTDDAAMGCLLGALVGDAAGATLEFLPRKPTKEKANRAMMMPGGGIWRVAPGQITDDGELTLCLAQALAQSKNFEIETVAQSYAQWVASQPFDIGSTTAASLGSPFQFQWQEALEQEGYAAVMTQAAAQRCMKSKANGSLMRISPLGIWGYRLSNEELARFAQQDSRLSHPNPSCCYAVACYTIAIASLLRKPGDRQTAFDSAKSWLESQVQVTQTSQGQAEVLGWLQDAENNVDIAYSPQVGFVKIAFTHAFRHLLLGSDYVAAIRETLTGGGDTDTNACIVGGLIGAAGGATAIPEAMQQSVL